VVSVFNRQRCRLNTGTTGRLPRVIVSCFNGGMLEHHTLLLLPPEPTGVRRIVDAENAAALGSARRREHGGLPWWRRPLWPVLEVRESDDEPLLFTLRRAWGLLPRRELCDADGRRVGYLQGDAINDAWNRRIAIRSWDAARQASTFRTRNGNILAWAEREGAALRLTFGEMSAREPFLKMLLLGAALSAELNGGR
jgi:hypothetical protein